MVEISSILTVVDGTPASRERQKAAAALAGRLQATTKLACFALSQTPLMMSDVYSADVFAAANAQAQEAAKAALESAREIAGDGVESVLVSAMAGNAARAIAAQALYADLVVLGAAGEDAPFNSALIEGALFGAAAPVLVWPTERPGDTALGQSIAIGWDARKEAMQTVRAALPLLRAARRVEIVTVAHTFGSEPYADSPGAPLRAWLAERGVSASLAQREGGPVGQVLIETAREGGADLIVMGGYGHSRLTEAVFGGVTERLLAASDLPLFMTH